ncbi:radical SAM protein [Desulfonema magnum]|uniref:Radical SAM domain-containing protein n=1 Tax=Desulfonema magnum TaxID=45655 RepID=A0A975GSE4_9BACT|nr:radical SAM protein [Desulfonema magnum]QTA91827.1 Radical SAM domain-containing protein [Desulfonema magnum]
MITAVVANPNGEIFELEGYAASGMAGSSLALLTHKNTVNMPYGGELMFLPDRLPVLYNMDMNRFETLAENPYVPGEAIFPVAAFNSPGYVLSYVSAYEENNGAGFLPLFSYGAVGWHKGKFRSAVILVDSEKRQDLRLMRREKVVAGVRKMRKKMPSNRLRQHLEKCALTYGCPAGKNFFLKRYEAPLPTSQRCNARCLGCISFQKGDEIPNSQDRIAFTPSPEEIAEVALEHIRSVKKSVVSFGQGCEGDPLLAADVIEPAIRIIRGKTKNGTINMNTNGSRPDILEKLFDAGLDSMRISMNSVREKCYNAYFRPNGYHFSDVVKGIDMAIRRGKFVSVNYLNCPGFTDTPEEVSALLAFLREYPINMIQWRNLNFDPLRYWKVMNSVTEHGSPMSMKNALKQIHKAFPKLIYGYFNPPKERFQAVPEK